MRCGQYDARLLEDLFREQYGNGSLLDTPARPFCFMTSTLASVVPAQVPRASAASPDVFQPFIWRNYAYPLDACSRYPGTCDASLVTALRATSAAPSYFDDVQHELGRHLDGKLLLCWELLTRPQEDALPTTLRPLGYTKPSVCSPTHPSSVWYRLLQAPLLSGRFLEQELDGR